MSFSSTKYLFYKKEFQSTNVTIHFILKQLNSDEIIIKQSFIAITLKEIIKQILIQILDNDNHHHNQLSSGSERVRLTLKPYPEGWAFAAVIKAVFSMPMLHTGMPGFDC